MESWDSIIIGGGLAGSATAVHLAKMNQRVLLLEKEKQAHDKVCGEFLSIGAQHYLSELDVDLASLNAVSIKKVALISGNTRAILDLPFSAMSVSRKILDEALLEKAVEVGAIVHRGTNVVKLEREGDHWELNSKDGILFSAQNVFLATGKHDMRGYNRQKRSDNVIGLKMHFGISEIENNPLNRTVELFLFKGGYVGMQPIENGLVNMGIVVSKKNFNYLGNSWDKLLEYIEKDCHLFGKRLDLINPLWEKPLAVSGIPYGFVYRQITNDINMYRLGDQMAVIPSFCGDGMSIALSTAKLAAKYAIKTDARGYYDEAYRRLNPQIKKAVLLSFLVESLVGRKVLVWLCKLLPFLIKVAIKGTRVRK